MKSNFSVSDRNFKYKSLTVELEIQQSLLGIVRATGSGKSTFLKNIVGLLQPQQDSIQFNQRILLNTQQKIHVPMYQRKIALIFQNALLFPHMNVQQNLNYAEKWVTNSEAKYQFEEVLELKPFIQRKAHQLSGEEAQYVLIGRGLLSSPNLLLRNEPLTGLDSKLKQQILPFLKRMKDELDLPMICVTHHLQELKYLAADIVQLKQRQIQTMPKLERI